MFNDLIMTKFSESTMLLPLKSYYCVVSGGCWDPEGWALPSLPEQGEAATP